MRNAAKSCPGCGNIRLRWQTVCQSCWRRLPVDLRNELIEAKAAQAFARAEAARVAAVTWLRENSPARVIARVTGEASDDAGLMPP